MDKKSPSHHYVQNSIIGQEQRKKVEKEKENTEEKVMEMEEMKKKKMEEKEIILPQPAPMLVEATREHKPVWTVTRQRPKQKTTAKPENRRKTKSQAGQPKVVKKVCWIGGGRSTLTCKQVRRKLVSGENEKQQKQNGRRRIQSTRKTVAKTAEKKEKSRMLLHADPQKENGSNKEFSFELVNRVVKKPEPVKNNKTVSKKTPSNKSKPKEKSEAAKARDEARKKMLEERKRMMKEKAKAQAAGEDGLILIM